MGGAAGSVLTGLFSETSPDETSEQRQAKRNLVLTIVTGIAAVADPDSAATANNAATANIDNNWLATQQKVQRNKELAEAATMAEQLKVYAKWYEVSIEQDFATGKGIAAGLKDGLAGSGLDTLNSMARFAAFPGESLDEIKEMISMPAMKALLGSKYGEMQDAINKAQIALDTGGMDQAEQLGKQIGHIISVAVSLVVAVEADAVKAAGQAAKFGVVVTKEKAGALMAGSSEKLAAQLATIEKYGFDGDVPSGAKGGAEAVSKIDLAPPPNTYPVYTRGAGAAEGPLPPGYTTVSRWVSPEEASLWVQNQGTAIPTAIPRNGTPQLYVTEAGAPYPPGANGTVRIDFAVPNTMLKTGNAPNNFMILQPSSSTPIYNVNIHVPNGVTLPKPR